MSKQLTFLMNNLVCEDLTEKDAGRINNMLFNGKNDCYVGVLNRVAVAAMKGYKVLRADKIREFGGNLDKLNTRKSGKMLLKFVLLTLGIMVASFFAVSFMQKIFFKIFSETLLMFIITTLLNSLFILFSLKYASKKIFKNCNKYELIQLEHADCCDRVLTTDMISVMKESEYNNIFDYFFVISIKTVKNNDDTVMNLSDDYILCGGINGFVDYFVVGYNDGRLMCNDIIEV